MHFVIAKTLLSAQNGINIYRGCTHGCIYCDSQSKCYHMDHAFNDVEVKQNAAELLQAELSRKRRKCMVGTGAMSDPYLHHEKELLLTRRCLEVILRQGCGVAVQTKSDMILRDIDLLAEINRRAKCVVQTTLTTFDENLCKILEPNVCTSRRRYEMLKEMQARNIPTVVWLSPILPFLCDTEENLRGLLQYCFDAGVKGIICFGFGTTMRDGSREPFYAALDKHFPNLKQKYIETYGYAYNCESPNNAHLWKIFTEECKKHGVMCNADEIFRYLHEFPNKFQQVSFLDE